MLGIVALSWHLLSIFGSFLGVFADIFLILFLSWILAFILEPMVVYLTRRGLPRVGAAVVVYLLMAAVAILFLWMVIPTVVSQLAQLGANVPALLAENPAVAGRVENFISGGVANLSALVPGLATTATGLALVFIISFYFLISRQEISKFILDLVPDEYEEDYAFLEGVVNTTFASFLRIQVILGLVVGAATFLILLIMRVDYALSTAVVTGFLAMVPVLGSLLFLFPPVLAALLVSTQKAIITLVVLVLLAQLVYNIWGPKLLGRALAIHPIIVLLSFLVGFKIAGGWGAVFAVPVVSAITVVGKELLKYWKAEADKS